jgi:hypothetical protein
MIQKVPYFLGLDLNIDSASRTVTAVLAAESIDASRPARVLAVDAPSSADHVPPVRGSLRRGAQGQELLVPRSISLHGLRAADLPRESAGYRGEPSRQAAKLYHLGIRGNVSRNTLANANATRDWRIYASFAERLIGIARGLYAEEPFGVDLAQTVYALDATTIDLCLSVFPWAPFRSTKAAVKLHTLLDLRGNIPSFIHISDGKMHDVNVLDLLLPEPGAYYVMDRGYLDFERLYHLHEAGSFFVTRAKSNLKAERRYSHPVDRATGLICDQTVILSGFYSHKGFPVPLRRIKYIDPKTHKRLVFLTNQFGLPALSIADLYRCRWQVELFFKWIKQHLRIKAFFGTSENAVKTQIWIAISVYVLVAIVKKRLNLPRSLYENLQILSLTLCEQMPLDELLAQIDTDQNPSESHNQMNLFD